MYINVEIYRLASRFPNNSNSVFKAIQRIDFFFVILDVNKKLLNLVVFIMRTRQGVAVLYHVGFEELGNFPGF